MSTHTQTNINARTPTGHVLDGHLDEGRHDGFGVIIVTFVIERGASRISLIDGEQSDEIKQIDLADGHYWGMVGDVSDMHSKFSMSGCCVICFIFLFSLRRLVTCVHMRWKPIERIGSASRCG